MPLSIYGGVEYVFSSYGTKNGIRLETGTDAIMGDSSGRNYFAGIGINRLFSHNLKYKRINIISIEFEYTQLGTFNSKSIDQEFTSIEKYYSSQKSARGFIKFMSPVPYYDFNNKSFSISDSLGAFIRLGLGKTGISDGPKKYHTGRKGLVALGFGLEYHTKYFLFFRAGVTATYFTTDHTYDPSLSLEEAGISVTEVNPIDVGQTNIVSTYSLGIGLKF